MATGTIIGGCCGGPPGAALGGMAGVYFGYRTVHDYQPLVTAVREMHDEERARLVHQVQVRRHGRVVSASRVGIGGGNGSRGVGQICGGGGGENGLVRYGQVVCEHGGE